MAINRLVVKGVMKHTCKGCAPRFYMLKDRAWGYKFGTDGASRSAVRAIREFFLEMTPYESGNAYPKL